MAESDALATEPKRGFSGKQVALIVLVAVLVAVGLTVWVIRSHFFASDFRPVELSKREQAKLDDKLRTIGVDPASVLPQAKRDVPEDRFDADGRLVPEKYSEDPGARDVRLSERELNALVASNPDLARRFALDLSDSLASAKLLIPVDPDMPVLGGKTLRVNAGLELDYRAGRPAVILRGVSVMGVPVPNAWLGNLKNVDLVEQFGGNPGFWSSFANGIEMVEIDDGELHIRFSE